MYLGFASAPPFPKNVRLEEFRNRCEHVDEFDPFTAALKDRQKQHQMALIGRIIILLQYNAVWPSHRYFIRPIVPLIFNFFPFKLSLFFIFNSRHTGELLHGSWFQRLWVNHLVSKDPLCTLKVLRQNGEQSNAIRKKIGSGEHSHMPRIVYCII